MSVAATVRPPQGLTAIGHELLTEFGQERHEFFFRQRRQLWLGGRRLLQQFLAQANLSHQGAFLHPAFLSILEEAALIALILQTQLIDLALGFVFREHRQHLQGSPDLGHVEAGRKTVRVQIRAVSQEKTPLVQGTRQLLRGLLEPGQFDQVNLQVVAELYSMFLFAQAKDEVVFVYFGKEYLLGETNRNRRPHS
jgi:hypothetical protein